MSRRDARARGRGCVPISLSHLLDTPYREERTAARFRFAQSGSLPFFNVLVKMALELSVKVVTDLARGEDGAEPDPKRTQLSHSDLLVCSQRLHRVYGGSAACGNPRSDERYDRHQERYKRERDGIERAYLKEKAVQQTAERNGACESDDTSDCREKEALLTTPSTICQRCAPSARRRPISRVRQLTI